MKVDQVQYRVNNQGVLSQKSQTRPNFGARLSSTPQSSTINVQEAIKDYIPSAVKGMKKLSDNMGEVQNIIINAFGTGLVAPIFIKWNPLSKTDEDTRTYSAWRQPVSAVLAVITQVGVTVPFNKMINRRSNSGFYDVEYNKSLFQDKDYIVKMLKKRYPYATKASIDAMAKNYMAEQKNSLIRMIKNDNIVMTDNHGKALPLKDEKFRQLALSVIDKQLNYQNSELNKCKNITIPSKIKRGEYYRTHQEEVRKIFNDINAKLNNNENTKTIKNYVKNLKKQYKNSDKELLKILEEILDRRGNNEADLKIAIADKLKGILYDIEQYKQYDSAEALKKGIEQYETQKRINPIEEAIKGLQEARKQITEKVKIGDVEHYITEVVGNNKEHRLANFKLSNKIAEALENMVKNNIKAHKQITGLIVSFLMLYVTCSLLNWIYPIFMDAVFPNLSNKKHPNEIKNLVDKANRKTEVK